METLKTIDLFLQMKRHTQTRTLLAELTWSRMRIFV